MKNDNLATYRRKRNPVRTPEPVPAAGPLPQGADDTFVIQEHHARRLHWDFRLERGGVLVSWAVPKGLPVDPKTNHLAVHTEDHPLEYAGFAGEIPKGEYGGGQVLLWDRGHYETEKWTDREVKVVLHGSRVQGRYVLFRTESRGDRRGGENWMIHRMDPPPRPDWQPLPDEVPPMLATPGQLPEPDDDDRWGYEFKWDGVRAVGYVEGGRARLVARSGTEITATYPEVRGLGESMGTTQAVFDGEIVTFAADGRPSFGDLQRRMHVRDGAQARRLAAQLPVVYLIFDVTHLDGRSTVDLPYVQRRELLDGLGLAGPAWQVPPWFRGGGADVVRASQEQGLEGVLAKRLQSPYRPGRRSPDWRKIKNVRTQAVVVGGWRPGEGRRAATIGSLLLGIPRDGGLVYVGHVGTGFSDRALEDITGRLRRLERKTSPFATEVPREHARRAHWVTPALVGEVVFGEWTRDGRMRHPSWRGLRPDIAPKDVARES